VLYLANPTGHPAVVEAMRQGKIGFIKTPAQGNALPDNVFWCADNGCYGKGYPGDDGWLRWLGRLASKADRCLFATAPDVVGEAEQSLERSLPLLPKIRETGFKAALVAQDGMENMQLPWDEFDCLFIGGKKTQNPADEWKLGAGAEHLIIEARKRGKWVHCGRVNSEKRYRKMAKAGCHSCDGTFLRFAPQENLAYLLHWVNTWQSQKTLF